MPRRINEIIQLAEPSKKKLKVLLTDAPSLDVSFCDDEALPPGIIFTDVQERKWRIGKPIGRGSFGRIYLASHDIDNEVTKQNARYVVKIEPHSNGPLFVEIHCLIRTARANKVLDWHENHKQKRLGMPIYIASGSFTDKNTSTKYRFLVLPRYDVDLQKIIARTRVLDLKNVLVLAIQIIDVLEFLHSEGYTHSDIKSSNLMLGYDGMKYGKQPRVKPSPSYQKGTRQVAVLSGKQRKAKCGKSRSSNYYDDEDFVIRDYRVDGRDDRLANVKNKLRKILSNRDSRPLHRHHAFNLRQLSSYVNYEDLNSSVCSDQSYQKLLDDFEKIREEFKDDVDKVNESTNESNNNLHNIYKEAILSQSNGQIYLLDYGLASKFLDSKGVHKDFGMDARKAHDGTLEYSSRDSHIGAHSRRSDLETLGYNLLDWLTGTLPWKTPKVLTEPDLVHALKKNFMNDIKSLLKTCFKTEFYPLFMEKYLQYVTSLEFTEKPDYDYCRSLFRAELLQNGYMDKDMSLKFMEPPISPVNRKLYYPKRFGTKNTPADFVAKNGIKKGYERENFFSLENDIKLEFLKQTISSSSDGIRKPCTSRNFFLSDADLVTRLKKSLMPLDILGKKLSPKNLRSHKKNIQKRKGKRTHRNNLGKFGNFMGSAKQFTWAEILAGNPEDIIRKERNVTICNNNEVEDEEDDDEDDCKYMIRRLSNTPSENDDNLQSPLLQKNYLNDLNPTYAMNEVIANLKKKITGKHTKEEQCPIELEGYTPPMIKLYKIKEKREAKEKLDALKEQNPKEIIQAEPMCTRSMRKRNENTKIAKNISIGKKNKKSTQNKTTPNNKLQNEVPASRVNRKKTSSIESDKDANTDLELLKFKTTNRTNTRYSPKSPNKDVEESDKDANTDLGLLEFKSNNRINTRNSPKSPNKDVEIVENPKSTTRSSKKSPRRTTASVPINRMKLRSSRRKK